MRFDERFFLGCEDLDLCLRARAGGWLTGVVGDPGVVHESGSIIGSERWYYYAARNPVWLCRQHRNVWWAGVLAARHMASLPRILVADLVKRRGFVRSRATAVGIWHGLVLFPKGLSRPYEWEPIEAGGALALPYLPNRRLLWNTATKV